MTARAPIERLKSAEWLHRPETQKIFALLDGDKDRTRAVGGVVRDTLLDRPRDLAEIDFATELTPDKVMRRAGEAGIGVYPTGIEHGTVTLKLVDLTAEVTTLRQDIKTDGRHAVVKFGRDWTRDAERRDFTLNALYSNMQGELFDPLGGGVEDCLAGVVKFIGDPDQRIAEDRLRVYRFFRFSASHGGEALDPSGLVAVTRAAGSLSELSAERVGNEMRRMLALPQVAHTVAAMVEARVLTLPAEPTGWLASYERHVNKANLYARLSLLDAALGTSALQSMWRLSNDDLAVAGSILAGARLVIDFRLNEAAYRHPAALADAVDVAATLANWTEAGKSAVVQRLQQIEVPRFPLNGNDLIGRGLKPGPSLGAELDRLERRWIESGFALGREALLGEMRR